MEKLASAEPRDHVGGAAGELGDWLFRGGAGVAGFVVPHYGWRAVFVVAALPALLVLPIRAFVPESPAPKDKAGDDPSAAKSDGEKAGAEGRAADKAAPEKAAARPGHRGSARSPLRRTSVGSRGRASSWPSGSARITGSPRRTRRLLKTDLGLNPGQAGNVLSLFNVGMMVGAIVCGFVASRKGVVLAVMVPALVLLPVLPMFVGRWEGYIALGAFLGGAFGAGYSGVTPLLLTSLFPANIRARCVGLAYHVGACIAAFVPPAITLLVEKKGLRLADAIMYVAGTSAFLLALSMLLRPKGVATETEGAARALREMPPVAHRLFYVCRDTVCHRPHCVVYSRAEVSAPLLVVRTSSHRKAFREGALG
ncbi:MAG: MFS transporter [Polyangiaceae bacterium]